MKAFITRSMSIALVAGLASIANAAPMPGTASSKLVEPKLGVFRSPFGFKIDAAGTNWMLSEAPRKSEHIATVYKSPDKVNNTRATLTVRTDKLKKAVPLNRYVKRWMKEYPKYGFDVIGSKKFKTGKNEGMVLDLLNRDKQRQVRQVLFVKDQKAVVMTCRDHTKNFQNSLKQCNQIVKTFDWF